MAAPWQEELHTCGLSHDQLRQFEQLMERLLARPDRGLTAVSLPESIVRVHFLDSLALLAIPEIAAASGIVDIGSGAGFPGLPLAIALPGTSVTMLEANHRKADFIAATITELGLTNAAVICSRAEEAGRSEIRGSFDVAVARAVGSLPEVLEYALPLVKTGGYAALQRGARAADDETAASRAAAVLGASLNRIIPAKPYPEARDLHVWIWEKLSDTPEKYPRRPGIPRKRPLN